MHYIRHSSSWGRTSPKLLRGKHEDQRQPERYLFPQTEASWMTKHCNPVNSYNGAPCNCSKDSALWGEMPEYQAEKLVKSYFGDIKLRFTVESKTTRWCNVEKGIVTGCTTFDILRHGEEPHQSCWEGNTRTNDSQRDTYSHKQRLHEWPNIVTQSTATMVRLVIVQKTVHCEERCLSTYNIKKAKYSYIQTLCIDGKLGCSQ